MKIKINDKIQTKYGMLTVKTVYDFGMIVIFDTVEGFVVTSEDGVSLLPMFTENTNTDRSDYSISEDGEIRKGDRIKTKFGVLTVKTVYTTVVTLIDTVEGFLIAAEDAEKIVSEEEKEEGKEFVAICKYDNTTEVIKDVYTSKKAFKKDLNLNGYKVMYSYIFTNSEYEKFVNEDKEFMREFNARLDKRWEYNLRNKLQTKLKEINNRYNM